MPSRPRPILIDMPLHIKEKIVHYAEIESRFQLRNCSQECRDLVDNIPTVYTNLSFKYRICSLEEDHNGYEFTVKSGKSRFYRNFPTVQSMDLFLKHFSIFLKNPKAKFEQIHIATAHFPKNQLKAVLSSLNHQVAVKNLSLSDCFQPNAEFLILILPYLKPGYLEHMDLGYISGDTDLSGITDLEQFKQAKSAVIRGHCLEIPIAKLLHFRRLECDSLSFLTVENVQTIIDNALRQGEEFDRWVLETLDSNDSIEDHFGTERTFNVPNSDHRLTFAHDGERFYLTNETRRQMEVDLFFKDF